MSIDEGVADRLPEVANNFSLYVCVVCLFCCFFLINLKLKKVKGVISQQTKFYASQFARGAVDGGARSIECCRSAGSSTDMPSPPDCSLAPNQPLR